MFKHKGPDAEEQFKNLIYVPATNTGQKKYKYSPIFKSHVTYAGDVGQK